MRLGFPWQPEAGKFSFASAVRGESIVRQWSEHERNLHAVLKIAGNSVRAMSADILGGLACFSHTNGDLSQWDIMNQACRSRVFSEGYPVSVIHNEESSFAIAGAMDSLRLWDFRSPGLVSIMKSSVKMPRCQALHCEGNVVSASQSDGFCRSCDTRKMQVGWLSEVSTSSLEKCLQENELEQVFSLWEKLSLFDEDESWDEPPIQSFLDESHHNSSSFALRCATIVRSLSSGNR
ncbi:hypothetical protein KP509_09G004700 [Ceratopteris richardii]|nr:hypothetical protein KP509_09G004700 [Ceratopteris richardii]